MQSYRNKSENKKEEKQVLDKQNRNLIFSNDFEIFKANEETLLLNSQKNMGYSDASSTPFKKYGSKVYLKEVERKRAKKNKKQLYP